MIRKFACAVALLVLSPAAQADEFFAVTPSGSTEALFDTDQKTAADTIASKCIDAKWTVIESSASVVTCELPMNMGQSIMGQLLMGNSYSTPPRRFYRFNVAQVAGAARVQASGWMELQMAFGQTRRTDFTGPEFSNYALSFLTASGARLPPGTRFPNHVVMGLGWAAADLPEKGVKISEVVPGGAADRAGLKVGDVLIRIAGQRMKSDDDTLDALAKAKKGATYEVEYYREGKKAKATVATAFRPAVEAPASPPAIASAPQGTAEGTGSGSIADEIAKFAKLRDAGVISATEFEQQKAKLLAR